MKKGYWIILVLVICSVLSSVILILMMPDQVPVHYNAAGVADRIGSRYTHLISPIAMVIIGLPFIVAGKAVSMKRTEEIAVIALGIGITASLSVVFFILLCKTLNYEAVAGVISLVSNSSLS